MKKILFIILLLTTSVCWAQTTATVKPDSTKVSTFKVTKKNDTGSTTAISVLVKAEDRMPEYPQGVDELMVFLQNNIQYPAAAIKKKIIGEVIIRFDVDTDGTLSNIQILKDIGGGCGAEAVRVVKLMPNWLPGIENGKPVKVEYKLPVTFPPNSFYK